MKSEITKSRVIFTDGFNVSPTFSLSKDPGCSFSIDAIGKAFRSTSKDDRDTDNLSALFVSHLVRNNPGVQFTIYNTSPEVRLYIAYGKDINQDLGNMIFEDTLFLLVDFKKDETQIINPLLKFNATKNRESIRNAALSAAQTIANIDI